MSIRDAHEADIDHLIALASTVYRKLPYEHYGSRQAWLEFIQNNHSLVYEEDRTVIAHGALEIAKQQGILSRAFVHPNHREKGIYSALVQRRVEHAQQHALEFLETYVATYTDAVQRIMIEHFNFTPAGIKLLDVEDMMNTGQRESLVVLRRPLSNTSVLPSKKPARLEGYVPVAYDTNGEWRYAPIPSNFDFSKVKLHAAVKDNLNLDW